jgi:hypothetical protein
MSKARYLFLIEFVAAKARQLLKLLKKEWKRVNRSFQVWAV